ncbi:uncharacterized protein LOC142665173 isoform X2 [Rhinoderma darwinii]|uniref:uncharacterized protein LOC142665173 isoform X2 n=1 Tax=Rhinoderma darwinii TaxID=43563 RepID=UPI003F6730BD
MRRKKDLTNMCNLCGAHFNSEKDLATHYTMPFHKFMMLTRRSQLLYMGDAKTLSEQIIKTGRKEPLIGLEYIYEYAEDSEGVIMYECKLCESAYKANAIFFHIVGTPHRVLYLTKHHPIMGIEAGFEVHQQIQYRKLANNVLAIELTHGRKKINVVNEVYVPKPSISEYSDSETVPEDAPDKAQQSSSASKDQGKSKKVRRSRVRKRRGADRSQRRSDSDDSDSRSRQRDRGSRRDSRDAPRSRLRDRDDDFDARSLHRDSRDNAHVQGADDAQSRSHGSSEVPKYQQDTLAGMPMPYSTGGGAQMLPDTRVGASAQRIIGNVPPYQQDRPFQHAMVPPSQLVGGPISQDAFQDKDFRSVNRDHGKGSSAAGDSKGQNKRRNRSPGGRSSTQRRGSRFAENCSDLDVRSVLPDGGVSFRELKAVHEGKMPEGFSSENLPLCKKKKQDKECDSDMEVCSMEFSDTDPDDFWCNEELFDFLKTYHVEDEKGVQYVMESVKQMSEALLRYRTRMEQLKMRITEEKTRLEAEKKAFLEIKKRKEIAIAGGQSSKNQAAAAERGKPTPQGTGTQQAPVAGIPPVVQPAGQNPPGTVNQPPPVTSSQMALASGLQQLVQRPLDYLTTQNPVARFDKGPVDLIKLAIGLGYNQNPQIPIPSMQNLLLGLAAGRYSAAGIVNQPPPGTGSQKALMPGLGPQLQRPPGSEMRFNQNPASRIDKGPADVTRMLGPAPGSRFDNFNPSKDPRSLMGQGPGRYSATENVNQPPQGTSSQKALASGQGPQLQPLGQRPQAPGSRFDNPNPTKEQRPEIDEGASRYQEPDSSFAQNEAFPGSWTDNAGSFDKPKPQGAEPDSSFAQNEAFPGSWTDNAGSFDKPKPQGAGPGTGFNQNQQFPGSRSDNPKESRPLGGQGYSDSGSRFNQNQPFPGSRMDNSGSLDKTKPPSGAEMEAKYKQMQWNSGQQSGNQGPYNETRPSTGIGAGGYDERYNQSQWQSQFSNRGAMSEGRSSFGSGMDRPLGPQSHQPTDSTGFSADRRPGTWPNQEPAKAGVYPAGILANKTRNLP